MCVDTFLILNGIRILSIVSLLLVFSSNIVTLVSDIKAVNRFEASGGNSVTASNSTSNATTLSQSAYIAYVIYTAHRSSYIDFEFPIAEVQSRTNQQVLSGRCSTDF